MECGIEDSRLNKETKNEEMFWGKNSKKEGGELTIHDTCKV